MQCGGASGVTTLNVSKVKLFKLNATEHILMPLADQVVRAVASYSANHIFDNWMCPADPRS